MVCPFESKCRIFYIFLTPCFSVESWVYFEMLVLHSFSLCSFCWENWESCSSVGSWLLVYFTSQRLRLLHLSFQGLCPGAGWILDGSVDSSLNTAGVGYLPCPGLALEKRNVFQIPTVKIKPLLFFLEPNTLGALWKPLHCSYKAGSMWDSTSIFQKFLICP